MKVIKKMFNVFMVSIIMICTCSVVYGNENDFTSKHIILKNDEKATIEKGYPVIIATNTTDKNLEVEYSFYYDIEKAQTIDKKISILANESVVIEIQELNILGKTGESRRVWFSWQEKGIRKPLQNQIDTYPFKISEKVPVELG